MAASRPPGHRWRGAGTLGVVARQRQEVERAGVLVIRRGRLALIERSHSGRRYWVVPGGGVEPGESVTEAALREAREELGVGVHLGQLRIRIDHLESDRTVQRQWYFDAEVDSENIRIAHGTETGIGTFEAVWLPLHAIDPSAVLPAAVVRLVRAHGGKWPDGVVEIDEG